MAVIAAFQNNVLGYPVYGVPYTFVFPILDADGDLVTGVAAATPDTELSKDGDTFGDRTELVELGSSGMYYVTLTAAEMQCSIGALLFKEATAGTKTTPIVFYPRVLPVVADAEATAGAAGTITLAVGSSGTDDYYNGCIIHLNADTGSGQVRTITDYVGSTRVASVTPNWGTNPDNTTDYIIYATEHSYLGRVFCDALISAIPTTAMRGTDNVVLAGPTKTEMDNAIATIIADTEDLQGNVDTMHDTDLPAVKTVVDAIDTLTKASGGGDLAAILADVTGIDGDAMVGTNGAALASSYTAALATILANFSVTRIGYLDELAAANLPTGVAAIPTTMRGTDNAATETKQDIIDGIVDALKIIIDKLDSAMEADGAVHRFTENALEEAPSGGNGGASVNDIWDESIADHEVEGSMAEALANATEITLEED